MSTPSGPDQPDQRSPTSPSSPTSPTSRARPAATPRTPGGRRRDGDDPDPTAPVPGRPRTARPVPGRPAARSGRPQLQRALPRRAHGGAACRGRRARGRGRPAPAAARAACGTCCRGSLPRWGSGPRSSRRPHRAGPPSRPAAATRSRPARRTTCSATRRPSTTSSKRPSALPHQQVLPGAIPTCNDGPAGPPALPPPPRRIGVLAAGTARRAGGAGRSGRRAGEDTLALTDRDGLYGAVKFALACRTAGIAPVLGCDLAVEPTGLLTGLASGPCPRPDRPAPLGEARCAAVRPSTPATPASPSSRSAPTGAGVAAGGGWARLCRLVSATHLRGERGRPVATLESVAAHARLIGDPSVPAPGSDPPPSDPPPGRRAWSCSSAPTRRWAGPSPGAPTSPAPPRPVGGRAAPRGARRRGRLPPRPPGRPRERRSRRADARLARPRHPGRPHNAVRYVDPAEAATADVLDSARRLVALDGRHVDRVSARGTCRPGHMAAVATEVARAADDPGGAARCSPRPRRWPPRACSTRAPTSASARCTCPSSTSSDGGRDANARLRRNCERRDRPGYPGRRRAGPAGRAPARRRARHHRPARLRVLLPHRRRRRRPRHATWAYGSRPAARVPAAWSTTCSASPGSTRSGYGLLMERFLSPLRACAARHRPRRRVRPTHRGLRADPRALRRRPVRVRLHDGHLPRAPRDPRRRRGARACRPARSTRSPSRSRTSAPATCGTRSRDLPELRPAGSATARLDLLFDLVERLDGLPRHIALHPCGVLLSDRTLLDRTPVEASWLGFPMSQFDKDDVEDARAAQARRARHPDAVGDGARGRRRSSGSTASTVDIDDAVPLDDEPTFELIRASHTLGCFQIESPGQRELIGKFGPETFDDLIIDISLFRPGPVKSDMVTPFLRARQGWKEPATCTTTSSRARRDRGVVVFHEQVLQIIAAMTGCTLAEADEVRRALGKPEGQAEVRGWFVPRALGQGLRRSPSSSRSGRCSRRSRRSASARRTPPRSPCRRTSRRGSRRTTPPRSSPACSPTTPACTPSG